MNRSSMSPTLGLQVHDGETVQDFEVTLHDREASLAEVFEALGLPDGEVRIDGSPVLDGATVIRALDSLAPGSRIELGARRPEGGLSAFGPAPTDSGSSLELSVVGGVRAGPMAWLEPGRYHIAQGPADDANAAWWVEIDEAHAGERAEQPRPWRDHGGTVEAVIASDFVVAIGAPVDPEPGPRGFVHRPPRSVPGIVVQAVELTDAPLPIAAPSPLSWATMLAPLPVALLMMFFFRPIFALFAAMGPLLALGRWYEGRRRFRRSCAERDRTVDQLRAELSESLAVQTEALARLRWVEHPHVPELWRRARSSSVRLWERHALAPGYGCATVGIAPEHVVPTTIGSTPATAFYNDLLQPVMLRPVPHVVNMYEATGIGIHGRRSVSVAIARALVLQLADLARTRRSAGRCRVRGASRVRVGLDQVVASPRPWPDRHRWSVGRSPSGASPGQTHGVRVERTQRPK